MRILLIGDLNSGLMAAKVGPLAASGWVKRIIFLSQFAGPPGDKLEYIVVPDAPGLLLRTCRRLRAAFGAMGRKPDVVVAYNVNPFGYLAWLLSRLYRVPYGLGVISGPLEIEGGGVEIENRLLAQYPFLAPLNERFALFVLRRALFITVTGTATRRYLLRRGLTEDRVHVLPSVVDPNRYHPAEATPEFDVVCLSNLIARKRIDRLLAIVQILKMRRPQLRVVIVGDGPLQAALEEQARAMDLGSCVTFAGWQPDVRPFLWKARVFVLTSVTEGLPLALMEAMACGVPGIVGDFGDVRDLVVDGENGKIVPEGDVEAYAIEIERLLADPALRNRFSAAAVASIESGYTVAAGVRNWARIYVKQIAPARLKRASGP